MSEEHSKYCPKCKQAKDTKEFHKDKSQKDGFQVYCKTCHNATQRKWRAKNKNYDLEYKRNYFKKYPGKRREKERKEKERHPHKYIARKRYTYALNNGKLNRPSQCSVCGEKCKPDGHHPDYSKPLEVVWLCKKCHSTIHTQNKEVA